MFRKEQVAHKEFQNRRCIALIAVLLLFIPALAQQGSVNNDQAANESPSSIIRTLNTAEVTYATTYLKKGFATLAMLGPGSTGSCEQKNSASAQHACLLDKNLGCATGRWCVFNDYQYNITLVCKKTRCYNYIAVAIPVDPGKTGKSFCSTGDAVVRTNPEGVETVPASVAECEAWLPVH